MLAQGHATQTADLSTIWANNMFSCPQGASQVAQWYRIRLSMQEMQVQSLGQEDSLEKEMVTLSSILAWRIPWTEELGRLYSPWACKESDTT